MSHDTSRKHVNNFRLNWGLLKGRVFVEALLQQLPRDRTRVCFTRYPRLLVGSKGASSSQSGRLTKTLRSSKKAQSASKEEHSHPFSFFSQQKVSGTERRRAHGEDILYARVEGSSGLRPAQ